MSTPKTDQVEGKPRHYSVGAVIEQGGKYLLINRVNPPHGFAGPAGHIDEGEDVETALRREVKEEVGLTVETHKLLFEEERPDNHCVYGVDRHRWRVFSCAVSGTLSASEREAKSIGWFTPEEMKTLPLEPVWEYWFMKLGILST